VSSSKNWFFLKLIPPADAASTTYMMTVVILNGTEGCRAAIKLVSDLEAVHPYCIAR
jgi:hypothetical protein